MLDLMRRQPWLVYPIFGGIIFVFVLSFGPGQASCERPQDASWAAKVDGEVISQVDFARLYNQQADYLRRLSERAGQPFTAELADRLGLPKQVVDNLIETRLLARQATRMGIEVDDDALRTELRERYGFDRFSYDEYAEVVTQRFDTTVGQFEAERRGELAARLLAQLIGETLVVSEREQRGEFSRLHDRARLSFVRFAPAYAQVAPPDPNLLLKMVAEEPAALEAQYAKDAAHFRTPAQMHLRQIMLPLLPPPSSQVAAEADEEEDEQSRSEASRRAARATMAALQQRLAQGEDFVTLAQEQAPEDDGAGSGGDLGWVSEAELAPALASAVRELGPGAVSAQPVETANGLHLLQLVERRDEVVKELPEVREEVALRLYTARQAGAAARAQAQALWSKLQAGSSFAQLTVDEDQADHDLEANLARRKGKKVRSGASKPVTHLTSWFLRSDVELPQLGPAPALQQALFAAPWPPATNGKKVKAMPAAGLLPQVYQVGDAYVVAALKDRELPDLEKFAAERDALDADMRQKKRQRVIGEMLAFWRGRAKVQLNPLLFGTRSGPG